MRLHVFSDLHVDVVPGFVPVRIPAADVVVVAGDVCEGLDRGMAFLRRTLGPAARIVMVAGNHEFYHRELTEERRRAARFARHYDIVLLDDETVVLDGVRFIGATLWTDFALYGPHTKPRAMASAINGLNDCRLIALSRSPSRAFLPESMCDVHDISRAFIDATLSEPFAGPSVVVTHHAPLPQSILPRFHGSPLNAAFASDLSALVVRYQPSLWIHGHMHSTIDYRAGRTRVLCNPHGYGAENPQFDPALVVEV